VRAWLATALVALPAPVVPAPSAPLARTVTVFAAASLTDAFTELGRRLERRAPGVSVRFNFAGSQQLVAQLEQGAPADVLASADQQWMRAAADRGLVAGGAAIFARNRLVVIVPASNPGRISRLEDLARPGLKLVLAGAAVPAGRFSREVLGRLGAAPGFPPDFAGRVLANLASEEENVRAVVAKIQLGEADAGMAYRSDVTPSVAARVQVFEIPGERNVLAEYPIAVLRAAADTAGARAFVSLVLSPEGQQVLEQHGFLAGTVPVAAPR
jgi:molybdate transport system substrate-binding protein